MRSLPIKRVAAAAILLAIPAGLTACSSGGSSSVDSASAHSTASSPPATEGPSDTAGKPAKQDVAAGMTKYLVGKGIPRSLVDNVANCIADKGYSEFSDSTLRALQKGKVAELDPRDAGTLTKVTTTCLAKGAVGNSLPTIG